jgi:hypothetical protein
MDDRNVDRAEEQKQLEEALPSLLSKLDELREGLDDSERGVLDEIIQSAARHTEFVQADDVSRHGDKLYMKPMSVHTSTRMKEEMLAMPKRFGIDTGDWEPGQR